MASNQSILREYLISLGFKVNSTEAKRFDDSILKSWRGVAGLATAALGAGTAVQAMVTTWARSMERMYYASRRAESSVGSLQALQFGAKMIGVSAESMQGALEGMARQMRLNPGLKGLVESFGIKVTGRQKADVMIDLIDKLKSMPFYVAAQYASLFGVNPDDLLLMEEGTEKLKAAREEREKMARDSGIDMDEAAKAALRFTNSLDRLMEHVGLLKAALSLLFSDAIAKEMDSLGKNLERFTGHLMRRGVGGTVADAAGTVTQTPRAAGEPWLRWALEPGAYDSIFGPWQPPRNKVSGAVTSTSDPVAGLPLGLRHHNPGNIMSGPGGTVGDYASDADGLQELANLLRRNYFDKGYDTVRKIVERYAPASAGNNVPAYISDLTGSLGVTADAKLNPSDLGQFATLMQSIVRHEGNNQDGRFTGLDFMSAAASGRPVVLQAQTTIYVTGEGAEATGRSVAREQARVGADMFRNLAGQGQPR